MGRDLERPAGLVSPSTLRRVVPERPGLAFLKVWRDCDRNKPDVREQSISAIKGIKALNEVTASCLPTLAPGKGGLCGVPGGALTWSPSSQIPMQHNQMLA